MLIKSCPRCKSERPLDEFHCQGKFEGQPCAWDLTSVQPSEQGAQTGSTGRSVQPLHCRNGHPVHPGDLVCSECGVDTQTADDREVPGGQTGSSDQGLPEVSIISGWLLLQRLPPEGPASEKFRARRESDGTDAILTLYGLGAEPDPEVYAVLQRSDLDHVPQIYEFGHWNGRAFEAREDVQGGTLETLRVEPSNIGLIRRIVDEIGRALDDFSKVGLRLRDLRPSTVLIREATEPDLVISGFGSARLSEFDLDIVSPLETSRYTAPEAIAGGVAAASDWWSLGMMVLEKATAGRCFEGITDQAFIIHVVAGGVPIPEELDPDIRLLLRGLLARDRLKRWQWKEVKAWLSGEAPAAPESIDQASEETGPAIAVGGISYRRPVKYALAAAEAANWDEAREQLLRGRLVGWAEEVGIEARRLSTLRNLGVREIDDETRLSIALKILNPDLPLVRRGEIVTPGWLVQHPAEGYALVSGDAPDILSLLDTEKWLLQLKRRETAIRERARFHEIELNEQELRVLVLSTSRARLTALWEAHRRLFPDTNHPGLAAIMDRRQVTDEDLIILLAASPGQYRPTEEVVAEARTLAVEAGVSDFDDTFATNLLAGTSRRALFRMVDERIENFAHCDVPRANDWATQFRLDRRAQLARVLVILSIPKDRWQPLPNQGYLTQLLSFFEQKVSATITRGPLARMSVTSTSSRIDLLELSTERRPAEAMLNQLLQRGAHAIDLDPAAFSSEPLLETRLRTLERNASLYKRDTGIDALYLGFPFLLFQTSNTAKPRIAPILLWPIRLTSEVGQRGLFRLSFDDARESVRLNPALEGFMGSERRALWKAAADAALGRHATVQDIVDEFGQLAPSRERHLVRLPSLSARVDFGPGVVICSAVLFNAAFAGQGLLKDLQTLPRLNCEGTTLHTMLRLSRGERRDAPVETINEVEKYFTAETDPSQEVAVLRSREPPGVVISGPPGTGKSQTIVNIVGDAIGQNKSLLVICQKQAALDVVYKRLIKEGLGDRIVLVKDVNSDRRQIIGAVRSQLGAVRQQNDETAHLQVTRQSVAKRIESMEAALDGHHRALHRKDPATGRSYRDLVGELAALDGGRGLRVLDVQRLVGRLPPDQLTEVEEACTPLVRFWLLAKPDDSPLVVLKEFGWDEATIDAFVKEFEEYVASEDDRSRSPQLVPIGSDLDDAEPVRHWIATNELSFKGMPADVRANLARWYDLFCAAERGMPPAQRVQQALSIVQRQLETEDSAGHDDRLHKILQPFAESTLTEWISIAESACSRPRFLGFLNIARMIRRRRLRRLLRSHGEPTNEARLAQFLTAARLETSLRVPREVLTEVSGLLGQSTAGFAALTLPVLQERANHFSQALSKVAPFAAAVAMCPWRSAAQDSARAGDPKAVDALFEALAVALRRYSARERSVKALDRLGEWCEASWIEAQRQRVVSNHVPDPGIATIRGEFSRLAHFQLYRAKSRHLRDDHRAVLAALKSTRMLWESIPEEELDTEFRRTLNSEARRAWIARLEQSDPALLMERHEIAAKIEALADADKEMRRLNRRTLIHGIDPARLGRAGAWEDMTRLQGARARRLRDFVDLGTGLGLMHLRPVWLMNPDVASELFPLRAGMFDLLVYDEASQMPVEHAIPTLYRAKTVIVSGDEKQLPPTSFFSSKIESDEAEIFEGDLPDENSSDEAISVLEDAWNRREIKDCPDLLSLARTTLPEAMLEIHYRSSFRELIQFSNAAFYGNRLNVPVRHPEDEVKATRPLEVVRVDGVYEHQVNHMEARRVADLVADQWSRSNGYRPSIGIVTFNRKQADLIEEQLEGRAERDAEFRETFRQELNRFDDGEDMSLFVKNVENVQGDERDLMIFSTTFGRNPQGTFRRYFGVLGQRGGERRLNVAITRARQKVILATSLPVADISDMLTSRRPPASPRDFLQAYLHYAECMSAGDLDAARRQLRLMVSVIARDRDDNSAEEDGFGRMVAAFVSGLGYVPVPAGDGGAFGIDYAIEHPRTRLFGIGIECDSPKHPLLATGRAREIWRPDVLRKAVPVIHRVLSRGWYRNREAEKSRLAQAISTALS